MKYPECDGDWPSAKCKRAALRIYTSQGMDSIMSNIISFWIIFVTSTTSKAGVNLYVKSLILYAKSIYYPWPM